MQKAVKPIPIGDPARLAHMGTNVYQQTPPIRRFPLYRIAPACGRARRRGGRRDAGFASWHEVADGLRRAHSRVAAMQERFGLVVIEAAAHGIPTVLVAGDENASIAPATSLDDTVRTLVSQPRTVLAGMWTAAALRYPASSTASSNAPPIACTS
jgi:hypothetical protein